MSENNRASADPDSEESIGGGVWPLPQDLDNDGVNDMLDILDEDRERSDEIMNVENVFVVADDMLVPPLRRYVTFLFFFDLTCFICFILNSVD